MTYVGSQKLYEAVLRLFDYLDSKETGAAAFERIGHALKACGDRVRDARRQGK